MSHYKTRQHDYNAKGEIDNMEEIYRTYEDTEVRSLVTNIKCPHCGREWQEEDMDDCGKTYVITCGDEYDKGCGKKFKMYFDAS